MTRPVCLTAPREPDHCWHLTGQVLEADPLRWEEVCCYCGTVRAFTPPSPDDYHDHGPPPPGSARMSDPKKIHEFDQTLATMVTFGALAARFYKELTDNDVPGEHAAHIVGKWVAAAATGGRSEK